MLSIKHALSKGKFRKLEDRTDIAVKKCDIARNISLHGGSSSEELSGGVIDASYGNHVDFPTVYYALLTNCVTFLSMFRGISWHIFKRL